MNNVNVNEQTKPKLQQGEVLVTVESITFNWHFNSQGNEHFERYTTEHEVGFDVGVRCERIIEHKAAGPYDLWYYDIIQLDGSILRIFNPNTVVMKPYVEPEVRDPAATVQ